MFEQTVIVVPTYNERDNIDPLLTRIFEHVPGARVLIVDDNSPDGTADYVEELAQQRGWDASVLRRTEKAGLGAAYIAGFDHALKAWPETERVVQMDADLSHDPASIPDLVQATIDADAAIGSRYVDGGRTENWPLNRILLSRLGTLYTRIITGLPLTDCTGGFKCWRAEVLRDLQANHAQSNGYCFQIEMNFRAWRAGYRLVDVPITFRERERGVSKIHLGITVEALAVVLKLGLERLTGAGRAKAK
jgi:dolichol-phosphate mannosyltransferase